MDHTQPAQIQAHVSNAILVTLMALAAMNIGFIVGIFARAVGHLTPYSASGTGAGAAITMFTIAMGTVKFLKSNDH
ncbi:hypothetical protein JK359_33735 [Streptomyces actinomycinicus]|uniref:Uncharacterized protein n=1 Tax=Streptomyces actinomycinicus TaxID=1695166 RepID=A0A937ERP2_9ACTN|nr:hypothetical protein [Streptomyces actinomycinicus]MBL1086870.1 hypothetical protein [Streptomyces actinomycinicus]